MTSDVQKAYDMLGAMQAQRDQALNAIVNIQADIIAMRRELASKDEQILEMKKKLSIHNED